MFQGGKTSIPKPAPRNLEDLDSVQRVLLHRSVWAPRVRPGWAQRLGSPRSRAPLLESVQSRVARDSNPTPIGSVRLQEDHVYVAETLFQVALHFLWGI